MASETAQTADARAAVTERLRRLARAQARLDVLGAELEGELFRVRRRREGAITRLQRRLDAMLSELEAYCRTEREAVLPDGRKSLATPFGEVSFRKAESALELEDGTEEEKVCASLRARDMAHLVRVRESVDRRALRRAVEEGRLNERELRRLGLALVERDDAFGCRLRREAPAPVGGQRG